MSAHRPKMKSIELNVKYVNGNLTITTMLRKETSQTQQQQNEGKYTGIK